jgi:N-acetyl-anhydromuramyl-L-alanine amidase AmpD
VVVAAGRANHAGAGNWKGLTGNSALFGTEAEAADAADFTPAQRDAYPRVNAAYCDVGKFGADMVCGHYEYAAPPGRKTDPRGYTMDDMRRRVAALLANPTIPALAQEDDLTPEQAKQLAAIHEKTVAQRLPLAGRPGADTDDPYGHVLSADAAARQALAEVRALAKTVAEIRDLLRK